MIGWSRRTGAPANRGPTPDAGDVSVPDDPFLAHRGLLFTIAYEMIDRDVLASRAQSVCVPFNLAEQYPRRLTPAERAFLEDWVEPAGTG